MKNFWPIILLACNTAHLVASRPSFLDGSRSQNPSSPNPKLDRRGFSVFANSPSLPPPPWKDARPASSKQHLIAGYKKALGLMDKPGGKAELVRVEARHPDNARFGSSPKWLKNPLNFDHEVLQFVVENAYDQEQLMDLKSDQYDGANWDDKLSMHLSVGSPRWWSDIPMSLELLSGGMQKEEAVEKLAEVQEGIEFNIRDYTILVRPDFGDLVKTLPLDVYWIFETYSQRDFPHFVFIGKYTGLVFPDPQSNLAAAKAAEVEREKDANLQHIEAAVAKEIEKSQEADVDVDGNIDIGIATFKKLRAKQGIAGTDELVAVVGRTSDSTDDDSPAFTSAEYKHANIVEFLLEFSNGPDKAGVTAITSTTPWGKWSPQLLKEETETAPTDSFSWPQISKILNFQKAVAWCNSLDLPDPEIAHIRFQMRPKQGFLADLLFPDVYAIITMKNPRSQEGQPETVYLGVYGKHVYVDPTEGHSGLMKDAPGPPSMDSDSESTSDASSSSLSASEGLESTP